MPLPITFTLDWNPSYSYTSIPKSMDAKDIPEHWRTLLEPVVPPERGLCEFRDITIEHVEAVGADRIFSAGGLPEQLLLDVTWKDVTIVGQEAGFIEYAEDWQMSDVTLVTPNGEPVKITHSRDVDSPRVLAP